MEKKHLEESIQFNNIVKTWFELNSPTIELEIRFGTKGIKFLTKRDYDDVIQKLKSTNFKCDDEGGKYSLRINNQFLDKKSGAFEMSHIRTEINSLHHIQEYCKSNDIGKVPDYALEMTNKKNIFHKEKRVFPANFINEFNFRVSLQSEDTPPLGVRAGIKQSMNAAKKTFRFMNRVTFYHEEYPVKVDISIVKYSDKDKQGDMIPSLSMEDSRVLKNRDTYEIEIEMDNTRVGPGTIFNTPDLVLESLRKVIKIVLSGFQGTNYPVSYTEQKQIMGSYMRMTQGEFTNVENRHFIGPNSVTLQMENIAPLDDNSLTTNIRVDYTVTEKADGDRHLLFVAKTGKIYLINTNMKVIFTGTITTNRDCIGLLLDGELIQHDKHGAFINLFAAFDIYFYKWMDIRDLGFIVYKERKSRLNILNHAISLLNPKSVVPSELFPPMKIAAKEFYYPTTVGDSIFSSCDKILTKVRENRFVYETDGLIFTPAYLGVGSDQWGTPPKSKNKMTWTKSFKWKPPQYNTIDFLVTTIKTVNGDDQIKSLFGPEIPEYKTVQLRCSFIPADHGYANPCQDLIDDGIYKTKEDTQSRMPIPVQFFPTNPYDNEAGIANIRLEKDDAGINQMFSEEGETFADNTIVEFSYDATREKGWRWMPLRVRHDKTTDMLQGQRNFGNAYHVANSNWKSIHNPISEEIMSSGEMVHYNSDDTYYNNKTTRFKTENMKTFHNTVKKMLIRAVCKKGDTLIDYACGKAGDLNKWVAAQLSFVFGIDIHCDNLEHKLDGACARVLNMRQTMKNMPDAQFVCGDTSLNIKEGVAFKDDKAKQITRAVFGEGNKSKLGKGVQRIFGKCADGFNVSSCQFAVHYFFKSQDILKGFMRNISECTQTNGYFIGTAYDGQSVFSLLKRRKFGESDQIIDGGEKMWSITKSYKQDEFPSDSSSIGYQIDVFQDSINKTFPEYLVNFDYFKRVMSMYGFVVIDRKEANELGLPNGSGMFEELCKPPDCKMTKNERKISFLNRYFVFKKVRNVGYEAVELENDE